MIPSPPTSTLFPYTTLFRSDLAGADAATLHEDHHGGQQPHPQVAPEDMGEKWMVHVEAGSVAFGSAFHKWADRKSTRLNSSHRCISYAVFCLKKKKD